MSTPVVTKAQWRKDAPGLLVAFCAITFLPLSIVLLRPRPISARTPGELIATAREQTAEESVLILSRHRNAWILQPVESRWQEIEQELYDSDNNLSADEVRGVLLAAKPALSKRSWPLYAKRAELDSRPVWIVASGDDPGDGNFFCGMTTQKEKRDWKVAATKNLIDIVIVSTAAPYVLITQ